MNSGPQADGVAYLDSHLHLQDRELVRALGADPDFSGISAQVTNGTHPDDWQGVKDLRGSGRTRVLKAFGVHPWRVDELPEDWERRLEIFLREEAVSVGEIGLDHWIENRDDRLQIEVFERQLAMASNLNLPPTIHCLRAWGLLIDCLQAGPELERGFLVHGFGGSREVLFQLLDLGGYVSFSAYIADPKRHRMREAVRACPEGRILVETDAPDMVPPEDFCRFPLRNADGRRLHHPAEIQTAYAVLAEIRGVEPARFASTVERTFNTLFGPVLYPDSG